MKNLILLLLTSVFTGCACMNVETAFGLDGKAYGWCKRKEKALDYCHGEPASYDFRTVICKPYKIVSYQKDGRYITELFYESRQNQRLR